MRTVAELKRLMRSRVERGEHGEAKIDRVIARLKEQRYLNDTDFATTMRGCGRRIKASESGGCGRIWFRRACMRRSSRRRSMRAYEDVNEEELARRHLERKRVRKPSNEKEAARVMRMLVRAGFSTGVIFSILKKWDVDEEALAALEFMDNDAPESSNGVQ